MIFQSLLLFLAHTFFPLPFRLSSVFFFFFSSPPFDFKMIFIAGDQMRSVDFELFSANSGVCFFIVLLLEGSVSSVLALPQMEIASAVTKIRRVGVVVAHTSNLSLKSHTRDNAGEGFDGVLARSLLQIVSAHCTTLRCKTHMCLHHICRSASD